MASKEVRHFGFWEVVLCCKSLKNLQNFWWTSRIITGWYSQAGKEAKAKANGEVAGRLDPKLLYQFVLEMSSPRGTWKWKTEVERVMRKISKDAWMALALLQRWAPTTARTSKANALTPQWEKSRLWRANSVGFLVGNLMEPRKALFTNEWRTGRKKKSSSMKCLDYRGAVEGASSSKKEHCLNTSWVLKLFLLCCCLVFDQCGIAS